MHVGALFTFELPPEAPADYLRDEVERMRLVRALPAPWSLRVVDAPFVGSRLPLMREDRDIDLDYHVRHSALPHPGGQRELGVLVSRLHSNQLDMHRPLWEVHVIEGLENRRFAFYMKIHHSLIDGVSGMRLIMRGFSTDPLERGMAPFWTVPPGSSGRPKVDVADVGGQVSALARAATGSAAGIASLGRAGAELARASLGGRSLQAPYRAPDSALGGHLGGQRRVATQQYDFARIKTISKAAGCSINDIVLLLSGTVLRRYLLEHARLPDRTLTAGIPVNLREANDQSAGGTAIGIMVAGLGTNIGDTTERLASIVESTAEAKRHLYKLPTSARAYYTLLVNGPWITGLIAGFGGRTPVPFNVAISNVPGPPDERYFNGARLEAVSPFSLLLHGNALNITCVSYAGTLNIGLTGARDTLPHLQRMAVYMGEAIDEIEAAIGDTQQD